MAVSRTELRRWLKTRKRDGHRWVVTRCDLEGREASEHNENCCYPNYFEDAEDLWASLRWGDATREIYDLTLPIEEQLEEERAWHPPDKPEGEFVGLHTIWGATGRWIEKEIDPNDKRPYLKDGTMLLDCEPGTITSTNGFVLGHTLRNKNGKIRCFLLNGDLGTRTNQRHQTELRFRLERIQKNPFLIVPFSALEAGQMDKSSVIPLQINEDRWEDIKHPIPRYNLSDVRWKTTSRQEWSDEVYRYQSGRIPNRRDVRFERRVVNLGNTNERVDWTHERSPAGFQINKPTSGGWYVIEQRHWLGDTLFKAKVNGRYRTFVSSFDYQEPTPLYFLAEVPPKAKAKTVADAILALSPPIVHAAVAQKREVKRQGDMFAIPTKLTDEVVLARTGNTEFLTNHGVFGTDHVATVAVVGKGRVTYAKGVLNHAPEGRPRDHEPCQLGDIWHLMVPNAVPRRRRGIQAARVT